MKEVTQYLIDQHREVEQMLASALEADEAGRRRLFEQAADHLVLHIESEERVLFPAIKSSNTKDILLETLEEHLSLKRLLVDLMQLAPQDDTYEAKLKVLREQTEHHHEEEEDDLFPKLRKALPQDVRERLAQDVDALQAELRQRPAPRRIVSGETDAAAPL